MAAGTVAGALAIAGRRTMAQRYDAVILGMGPGGEVAASRLIKGGKRVAIVEKELIGGECAYWACIPSKTLLRPPEVRSEAGRAFGTATPYAGVGERLRLPGLDDPRPR